MNMMRNFAITLAACLACLGAAAQSTTKLSASKANEYGIVYSLPVTVLDITFETEYAELKPGEFYNYANLHLNIDNAIAKPQRTAGIKSVVITTHGVPDPENEWLVQLKAGQPMFVVLDKAGIPLTINAEDVDAPAGPVLPVAQKAQPTPLEVPAAAQAATQEMVAATSLSKRAQLAAERVFELRQNRNDLISGQADNTPPDGKSMQLALDNLTAQEAALVAMFAGTKKTWTEVNTVSYTPSDDEDPSGIVIARLSPIDGIVGPDNLSGEPIYLSVNVIERGIIPTGERGETKPFPKNGVAYTIPGTAEVTINFRGKKIASQRVELAQLGVDYGLDPKIFVEKKSPAFLIFNPATGGISTLGIKEN